MTSLNNTYRIIALTLALLMFISSVGFSIDMHYCQGQLKSFSLIGKAKSCHELAKIPSCHHRAEKISEQKEDKNQIDKKGCCDNKTMQFQSDHDQQIETTELLSEQLVKQFIFAYVFTFYHNNTVENKLANFANYRPPLIPRDIPVLFESFLL